jgi:hypothetical protein
MEKVFEVSETGLAAIEHAVLTISPRNKGAREILARISDPLTPIADISRLITVEIAAVLAEMNSLEDDPTNGHKDRSLNNQIKTLRELQKSLMESDVLSKRDVLNFDGEKFAFVLGKLFSYFQMALKEAGIEPSTAANVEKQFSDILKSEEEKLRRETDQVGSK